MVYFECYACGDSLKKPQVQKHLWRCQTEALSCVDCMTWFDRTSWQTHTKCMTENQKYQGRDYQPGSQPVVSKGQAKQDEYRAQINRLLEDESHNVSASVKAHVQSLSAFENVPRKQKPFFNFVKNSLKIWNDSEIQGIWNFIQQAQSQPVQKEVPNLEERLPVPKDTGEEPLPVLEETGQPFQLVVSNLRTEIKPRKLEKIFESYKSFQSLKLVAKERSGKPTKWYAYVSFGRLKDGLKALQEENGRLVKNQPISLKKHNWTLP